jgi:hypothetical protein
MKKLLSLVFLMCFVFAAIGQSTSPRWGTTPGRDNTGRVINYKLVAVTDVAGNDTVFVNTNASETYYKVAALDSINFKVKSVANAYFGDEIVIVAQTGTGTPKIKFSTGSGLWLGAGTATLAGNKRAVIKFVFDGAKWVETGRYVQ